MPCPAFSCIGHFALAVACLGVNTTDLRSQQTECGQDTTATIRVRLKDYLNIPQAEAARAAPGLNRISNYFGRLTAGSKGLLIQEYRSYGSSGEPRRIDVVFRIARLQCEKGRPTSRHTGVFLFHVTFAVNSVIPMVTETAVRGGGTPFYNILDTLAEPTAAVLHTRSANVDRVRGKVENWLVTRDATPPWRVATRREILEWNVSSMQAFVDELHSANAGIAGLLQARRESLAGASTVIGLTKAQRTQLQDVFNTASETIETAGPLKSQIEAANALGNYFKSQLQAIASGEAARPAYLAAGLLPVLRDSSFRFVDAPVPGEVDGSALRLKDFYIAPNPNRMIRSIIVQVKLDAATPIEAAFAKALREQLDPGELRKMVAQ